jgi:hypothetical protein
MSGFWAPPAKSFHGQRPAVVTGPIARAFPVAVDKENRHPAAWTDAILTGVVIFEYVEF